MKVQSIKYTLAILFVTIALITINSCKKTDRSNNNNNEAAMAREKAIQATIERYGRITAPVIMRVNQPASFVSYKIQTGK
ncbi:MAG: hypothetical protein IPH18_13945 [Chitinophagaceae bacterium]|jgi:hypothetical protein|nr:hypothetical protein [Chitinophagaceae bacterium]